MRRPLRRTLLGLTLVVLLGGLALGLLLGTAGGSRWLLAQVPGLQVQAFEGRLGSSWSAAQLRWEQGDKRLLVEAPRLSWSPSCLLRATLCLDQLQAGQVQLLLPPAADSTEDSFELADLTLPLSLELGQLDIRSLQFNGLEQAHAIRLAAHWTAQGLRIEQLSLRHGAMVLALQGRLHTQGDWPLQLEGQLQLPAPERQAWSLALQLQGDLRQSLRIEALSSGYLEGRLSAALQPLEEHLPGQLHLRVEHFKPYADLPGSLSLQQLELQADGDLQAGYQLTGSAQLPAEQGAMDLSLAARIDALGAQINQLRLSASPEQQLLLSAQLDWQHGLNLDSRFALHDFPWQRLYPLETAPPVSLRTLEGELSYADGNYLGHFAAELDGPAGAFSLQSPLSGNLQQVFFPELQLQAGQGRADGRLGLGFAGPLSWDLQLQLEQLDPAYWLAQLPGRLAGPLSSSGSWTDQQLRLMAKVDLAGRLREQPAAIRASFTGDMQQGELSALELRLGDNRISGQAALGQQLSGQLLFKLPGLAQLWPGLQGQLQGQLDLAGSPQTPQGQLQLQGQRLAYQDRRLHQFELRASLDSRQQGELVLDAQGLRLGDQDLGQLSVKGAGNRREQHLDLQLQGPLLQSQLALAGSLEQGIWRGNLLRGELQGAGQDWRLQQPAQIERLVNGQLSLGAHCWRFVSASLCADRQRLLPAASLGYRLSNFPLDSLASAWPKDFAWQGQLNGQLQLDLAATGPNGSLELDAGSGVWRIRENQQWLEFGYDKLRLSAQLHPQRIDSLLELRGAKLGELVVQAQLDPRPANKPLSGSLRLSGLDLALARPFLPMLEQLGGQLNGDASLSGTLLAPRINGQLRLDGGQLSGAELPLSVSQLQLLATIHGQRLQLEGGWRSGEQGQARLSGELDWSQDLAGELRLDGQALPFVLEPYAALEVAPKLRLRLLDQQLSVSGEVLIPSGKIEVRELPPSTVKLSSDAVVVGQSVQKTQYPAIAMDVAVVVGQQRLSFKGFGLQADLAGRVHIGNDLDTRGELSLNKGRFRAYGQRLSLRRARLLFTGPIDQPYLDIEAIRRVDQVIAGLRLSGNAAQPNSQVFSEPAMSQEQALSYLVLGRPLGQSGGDSNMLAQAALALGMSGSAPLVTSIAQGLGISDFQLDTEGSGATTSVVASGNLSERLSLRYGVGVFEPANTLALRYELSRKLYLEAASGLASSLDLFYRRDF